MIGRYVIIIREFDQMMYRDLAFSGLASRINALIDAQHRRDLLLRQIVILAQITQPLVIHHRVNQLGLARMRTPAAMPRAVYMVTVDVPP